ncbi:MAG: hypothetical protein FWH04_10225 [Oscillospiraceae bacterium]|nr:hypothetical protein [Oscillospiraceae bacterium]
MKRNKILWVVIVGLMVLCGVAMPIWQFAENFTLYTIAFVIAISLPVCLSILIIRSRLYKMMCAIVIPSIIQLVFCMIEYALFFKSPNPGEWGLDGLSGMFILISIALLIWSTLCLLLVYIIKKIKNKKGEDTSC